MNSEQNDQREAHRQPNGKFGAYPPGQSAARLSGEDGMRTATGVPEGVNPLAGTGSLAYPPPIESTADAIHFGSTVEVSDDVCSRVIEASDRTQRSARKQVRDQLIDEAKARKVNELTPHMGRWYSRQWIKRSDASIEVDRKHAPKFAERANQLSDEELHLRPEIGRADVQSVIRSYAMVANAPKVTTDQGVEFEDPEQLAGAQLVCDGHKQPVADIYDTYLSGREDLMSTIEMPRREAPAQLDAMVDQLTRISENTGDAAYNTSRTAESTHQQLQQARENSALLRAGVNAQLHANKELRTMRGYADAADSRRLGHNQPQDTLRSTYRR